MPHINFPTANEFAGKNTTIISFADGNRLYFSYKTLIAFYVSGKGLFVSNNRWTTTTGKHISAIQTEKTGRLTETEFALAYAEHWPQSTVNA